MRGGGLDTGSGNTGGGDVDGVSPCMHAHAHAFTPRAVKVSVGVVVPQAFSYLVQRMDQRTYVHTRMALAPVSPTLLG